VRAMGPASRTATTGRCGITPWVGLMDASPHRLAGRRTEPAMSEPMLRGPRRAARAAAAPLDEPLVLKAGFQGLRVTPNAVLTPAPNVPWSGMVVLANSTAPASRRRAAGGPSSAEIACTAREPTRIGVPCMAMLSLIDTGTPSRGPSGALACQRFVDASAACLAAEASRW